MGEYISREAVVLYLKRYSEKEWNPSSLYGMMTSSVLRKAERAMLELPAADVQPVNQWVSTKDRLPEEDDEYLAVVDGVIMEVSYSPKQKGLICVWSTCDADGFRPLPDDAVTHWMPFPELPQD